MSVVEATLVINVKAVSGRKQSLSSAAFSIALGAVLGRTLLLPGRDARCLILTPMAGLMFE